MTTAARALLAASALIVGVTLAVRWIDRCDCRFANETDSEEE